MKSRKELSSIYDDKYSHIPKDNTERLNYLYDALKINEKQAYDILVTRDNMMNSLYYTSFKIILYEIPDGAKRHRYRLINRKNISSMAISNPDFIHVYSPNAKADNDHMRRLVSDEDFKYLDGLICTPCNIHISTYHKTPSYYNKKDIILSEIGIKRPIVYPDWDNIGKKYSDMYNSNIWIDDILVIDGSVSKYYSVLPRVEIDIHYLNMVYDKQQYNKMINRKDYKEEYNLDYYGRI